MADPMTDKTQPAKPRRRRTSRAKFADNWVHRSKGMSCLTCMWFIPKIDKEGTFTVGRCRRHAPTMNGWPVMFPTDWCGDHKLNENQVGGP